MRKLALQLDTVLDSTFAPKAVDALARAVPNVEAIAVGRYSAHFLLEALRTGAFPAMRSLEILPTGVARVPTMREIVARVPTMREIVACLRAREDMVGVNMQRLERMVVVEHEVPRECLDDLDLLKDWRWDAGFTLTE